MKFGATVLSLVGLSAAVSVKQPRGNSAAQEVCGGKTPTCCQNLGIGDLGVNCNAGKRVSDLTLYRMALD